MPAVHKATQSDAVSGRLLGICKEERCVNGVTESGDVGRVMLEVAMVLREGKGLV
jgi:hypothetical protein